MNLTISIKVALALQGRTQTWLAEEAKMSTQRLSKVITTGKANSTTIERLASALGVLDSELIAMGEE